MSIKRKDLIIENVSLMFKNFDGAETMTNRAGTRNVCVVIDSEDLYNRLHDEGWNVKTYTPKQPDKPNKYRPTEFDPIRYLPVAVRYDGCRPPKITIITEYPRLECDKCHADIDPDIDICPECGNKIHPVVKRRVMNENTVGELDRMELENVDVVISPYDWTLNGSSGVKAYLTTMYATVKADPLDLKWAKQLNYSDPAPDDDNPF